jgi:membrane-associated phospholipid phosphatase
VKSKLEEFIFKLRLEEFMALVLLMPMLVFLFLFHDKEGFRASNIDRFLITALVFIVFLGIIKLKDLEVLKETKIGRWISHLLNFLRETLPFAFCISIYTNMHDMVHLVNPNDVDALLIAWDEFILGTQPALYLEPFISPNLTDFMYFSYGMFLIYVLLFPFILYAKGDMIAFRETTVSIILTFYIGYIGYLIFPAVGPKFTLAHLFETSLTGSFITDQISFLMDYQISAFTRRDCFPSLHNGIIFLILLFAFKHNRFFGWVFLPFALSLFASTLYLRYHYFIDMIAGYALATAMFFVGPKLHRWWRMRGSENQYI